VNQRARGASSSEGTNVPHQHFQIAWIPDSSQPESGLMDDSALAAMRPCAKCRGPAIVLQCLDLFASEALLNSGGAAKQCHSGLGLQRDQAPRVVLTTAIVHLYSHEQVDCGAVQQDHVALVASLAPQPSRSQVWVSQKPGDAGSNVFASLSGWRRSCCVQPFSFLRAARPSKKKSHR
jgi:hypothetical protein